MRKRLAGLAAGLLLALPALDAQAHAISSAQWRLTQVGDDLWDSRLRLPEDLEGRLLSVQPSWPDSCERLGEPQMQPADGGSVLRWTLRCPSGLTGALSVSGFNVKVPDAVLVLEPRGQPARYAVLSASQPSWTVADPATPPVAHYLWLGAEHILLGADHLLFVLGLWALWARSGRRALALLATLSAFTLAHSLTLAGATLQGWALPQGAVEASIAASILLLAVELATDARGLAFRRPATVAFAFGLLHGFGFAGALAETGLPEQARAWALAAFNAGVELGQIGFVAALMLAARTVRAQRHWAPAALCVYGSVAAYWVIARSAAVFA